MKNRNIYINLLMLVISFTASLSYAQVDGMAIDQINDNYGYYLLDRTSGWQSFTAGTNGHLGAVELYFYSTGTNTSYSGGTNWSATLRIHEGEGTSGAILAEQPITGDGVKQRQTYILEMPVRQIAESKYTFSFEDATAGLTVRASTNSYTNGRSHNSIYDYNFKTYVLDSNWSEEIYRDTNFTTSCSIISNEAQMAQFAYLVNNGYSFMGSTLTLNTNLDLSAHYWTPIGSRNITFQGTFNGGSNIISNIIIDQPDTDYQGLFGHVSGGSIHDLNLTNLDITGKFYVAGLCGKTDGPITGCTLSGCIRGKGDLGGLVGKSESNIVNCVNNCSVYSDPSYGEDSQHIGGIAGECYSDILDCSNSGSIEGAISVAGIVGNSKGIIDGCLNTGIITCNLIGGGIASRAESTIQYCNNSGNVTGNVVGGIVAGLNILSMSSSTGIVQYCENSGSINGTGAYSCAGGITTDINGIIQNCVNSGAISGNSAGGISTFPKGIVQNCVNRGTVTGLINEEEENSYAGGIVADIWDTTIRNCNNSGNIIGSTTNSITGGISGWNEEEYIDEEEPEYSTPGGTIQNCCNNGAVSGLGLIGGLAGRNGGTISNSYWKQTGIEPFIQGATGQSDGILTKCSFFGDAPGTLAEPVSAGWITTDDLSKALNAWMIDVRDAGTLLRRWSVGSVSDYPTLINSFWKDEGNYTTNWYDDTSTTFSIGTAKEIAGLTVLVNSGVDDFSGKLITLSADIELGNHEWTPIGNISGDEQGSFKGAFNGNGKTISGIYVDNPADFEAVGFFGLIEGVYVVNLQLRNVDISGSGFAGGLVGYLQWAHSINNSVSGYVSAYMGAGGIAGLVGNPGSYGLIWNCWSDVWVSGEGLWGLGGISGSGFDADTLIGVSSYWKHTGTAPYDKPADGQGSGINSNCYSFAEAPGVLNMTGLPSMATNLNNFVMDGFALSELLPELYGWTTGTAYNYPVMIPLICVNGEYIQPQNFGNGFTADMTVEQVNETVSIYTNAYPETNADTFSELMKKAEMMGFTFAELSVDNAILDFDPKLVITGLDPLVNALPFSVDNGIDETAVEAMNRLAGSVNKKPTVIQMILTNGTETALVTSTLYHTNGTATASFTPDSADVMTFKLILSHESE